MAFLEESNIGGEYMDQDKVDRVKQIAKLQWRDADGELEDLLNENEIHNLTISRGTLTPEERTLPIRFRPTPTRARMGANRICSASRATPLLQPMPSFTRESGGTQHGTGYPRGLKRDEMSVPARMVAIADIF